jgi:hypothetical protein
MIENLTVEIETTADGRIHIIFDIGGIVQIFDPLDGRDASWLVLHVDDIPLQIKNMVSNT